MRIVTSLNCFWTNPFLRSFCEDKLIKKHITKITFHSSDARSCNWWMRDAFDKKIIKQILWNIILLKIILHIKQSMFHISKGKLVVKMVNVKPYFVKLLLKGNVHFERNCFKNPRAILFSQMPSGHIFSQRS